MFVDDYNDYKIISTHPSKDIKSTLGTNLLNKKIVVCVTASVACYKTIDLIRLLIRHGAEVFVVMSKTVEKFISKDYFVWASGNKVVSILSGDLEHIMLADYGKSDLVVVYPSTANTIGKFANGIDDTPPTTILSVALGSKIPIVIAPAMHESMYENEIIKENIAKLEQKNVIFVNPKIEEGKAKIADINIVFIAIINILNKNSNSINNALDEDYTYDKNVNFIQKSEKILSEIKKIEMKGFFKDKRILISLGSTVEYIDPIRVVSNTSSGKMGVSLVKNALDFGSNVTIVKGFTTFNIMMDAIYSSPDLKVLDVTTSQQMFDVIIKELKSFSYDIVILAAAVSDFKPSTCSDFKITSDITSLNLTFVPTIKIIDKIKNIYKDLFLVAFKADFNVSIDTLLQKSFKKMVDADANLVVANDVGKKDSQVGSDYNEVFLIDKNKNYYHFPIQTKYDIANKIFKIIYLNMYESNQKDHQQTQQQQ
ncbi:MAG: bifunctional phosphopantothenoylcysteine decarboxylase/phosphopantothenate--cysteine ligase CoaBC [Thermoproteota archaeon]|nr:bifunctional phosphopantothenoylcysteine decarboxylase/phosphopantothenate--cysteine ligase CoaBC [Thermoproteota archaeon]